MRQSGALARHRDDVLGILDAAGVGNPRVFGSVARSEDTEASEVDYGRSGLYGTDRPLADDELPGG
jgi:hypothetical protein